MSTGISQTSKGSSTRLIFGLWPVMKTYRGIVGTKNSLLIAQMCWVSMHVLFYQRFFEQALLRGIGSRSKRSRGEIVHKLALIRQQNKSWYMHSIKCCMVNCVRLLSHVQVSFGKTLILIA
jgi:hypothetical protein